MLILASALLLRDKRYFFENYPGLHWGPPQISHDVMRLKCRLLLDFFGDKRKYKNDIIASDFKVKNPFAMLDRNALQKLERFKQRINMWTIHLSWIRTEEAEYSKTDRQLMEECTLILLGSADRFIEECLGNGIRLTACANPYRENFKRVYAYLLTTSRIEEGKGKRHVEQIRLEALS
jgi:hypothetical protein